MKLFKSYKIATIAIIAIIGVFASSDTYNKCYAKTLEVTVSEDVRLADVLGDGGLDIDELIVEGYVADADFTTMLECVVNGKLQTINLSKATLENDEIPNYAFNVKRLNGEPKVETPFNLKKIILPESVIRIGWRAFELTLLEDINLPVNLKVIDSESFAGTNIGKYDFTLPESLERIGMAAMCGCSNLKSIKLPSNLSWIDEFAFYNSGLEEIEFNGKINFIGMWAFKNTMIKKIDLSCAEELYPGLREFANMPMLQELIMPEYMMEPQYGGTYEIANSCPNLSYVKLPINIERIGTQSFTNCKSLTVIDLPTTLQYIDYLSFYGTSLKAIVLPENITNIDDRAFAGITTLKQIYSMSKIPPTCHKYTFNKDGIDIKEITPSDCIVYVPIGCGEVYRSAEGWNYFENFVETDQFSEASIYTDFLKSYNIEITHDGLRIENPDPFSYRIFKIDGSLIKQSNCSINEINVQLETGVYIVSINNTLRISVRI